MKEETLILSLCGILAVVFIAILVTPSIASPDDSTQRLRERIEYLEQQNEALTHSLEICTQAYEDCCS